MRKHILLISRHAPYGTSTAKEALDALLAAAVYNQNLGILFMDDGIFQLLNRQDSVAIEQKNIGSILPALHLYEIENIYVHWESMQQRGINTNDLVPDAARIVDSDAVRCLLAQQDQLLSF